MPPRQTSIFDWHTVTTNIALTKMAVLDFADAGSMLTTVLKSYPQYDEAVRGLACFRYWTAALKEVQTKEKTQRSHFLWKKITAFEFNKSAAYEKLRTGLLRFLLELVDHPDPLFIPPDYCIGHILLMTGDYYNAECSLRSLLEHCSEHGIIHLYLGESLHHQKKEALAKLEYTKALLLAPEQTVKYQISMKPVAHIISTYGPYLAPIYGYFKHLLPLAGEVIPKNHRHIDTYSALQKAEYARIEKDYQQLISSRKALKKASAEIFAAYLAFIDNL